MSQPPCRVSCGLVLSVVEPVRLTLQLAVAGVPSACLEETLEVSSSGSAVDLVEVVVPGVGRVHVCTPPPGRVEIGYSATVSGQLDAPVVGEAERIVYRRPSRYAESDRLAPMAQAEFAGIADHAELLGAVSSWVGSRLSYVAGSSGPTEGAVDTMLKRQGVCRDYAHLVVALLRALDVPARLAAVYAPGLDPMDFGTGRRRVRGGGSPVGRGSIRSIMCGWACQFMNPRSHARKASMSMAWLSAQLDRPASSASTFRRIVGSPAASWSTGQSPSVSTIASRGNDEVMIRGTFANIRLRNQLAPGTEGGYPVTSRQPTGQ